jgi:hypothetical protein
MARAMRASAADCGTSFDQNFPLRLISEMYLPTGL